MKSNLLFKLLTCLFISIMSSIMFFYFSYIVFELSFKIALILSLIVCVCAFIVTFFVYFISKKYEKFAYQNTNNDINYEFLRDFGYLFDPEKFFELNKKLQKCECCGEVKKYIYTGPFYAEDEIEVLCPDCIKSGKASKKFDGVFNVVSNEDLKQSIIDEVTKRTPSVNSWQDFEWVDCCNDLCMLYGLLTWDEIEELEIEDEVTEALMNNDVFLQMEMDLEELKSLVNDEEINLIVFRCMHCDQFYVIIDFS